MLGTIAAIALVAGPAPAHCALAHLQACTTTNELFYDRRFVPAVKRFVGKGNANYLYRGTLAEQQIDVLGGPPDDPVRVGDLYRFTACRAHSCPEKGAVVLTSVGEIVATAILHSACAEPRRRTDCYAHDTLTLFVRNPKGSQAIIADLTTWAREQIAASYTAPGMAPERLDGVEIFSITKGRRARFRQRADR